MRTVALAVALAAGLVLTAPAGCTRTGARVGAGIDSYERGAYEGALLRFRDVGSEEAGLRAKTRLRYLAYRGLAHWHVGQQQDARRYLGDAQGALADKGTDPKWLPFDVREELARASAELGLTSTPAADGSPGSTTARPAPTPPADAADAAPEPTRTDADPTGAWEAAPSAPPPSVGSQDEAEPSTPALPPSVSPPPADAL